MTNSMYGDLAKYYELIYAWKDYKKESKIIKQVISEFKKSDGNALLEVACGTGKHLENMKKEFSCTGLDLNEGMLRIARKKFPNIRFIRGNMIDFKIDGQFDVITCLFSSIGYVRTYANLRRTLKNFYKHLKKGGAVVIEPWFTKSTYKVGMPHMHVYENKDMKIVRANVSKAKDGVSIMEMHYLVAEKGKDVKHFVSVEKLGMFEVQKTLKLMRDAGFKAKFLKRKSWDRGRGLFVGVKEPKRSNTS